MAEKGACSLDEEGWPKLIWGAEGTVRPVVTCDARHTSSLGRAVGRPQNIDSYSSDLEMAG